MSYRQIRQDSTHEQDLRPFELGLFTPGSSASAHPSQLDLETGEEEEEGNGNSNATKRARLLRWLARTIPVRNTYERLHNGWNTGRMLTDRPGRFYGHGTDGVFRNLVAKPDVNGDADLREQWPPLYDDAAADMLPEYWELAVVLSMYDDEVFIEGLPVGNIALFMWNALVLVAFQWIGFLLCYLLHTSHASKHGARMGLGINLIMSGWKLVPENRGRSDRTPPRKIVANPTNFDFTPNVGATVLDTYTPSNWDEIVHPSAKAVVGPSSYFAYSVVAFGSLVVLFAMFSYAKVKKAERDLLAPRAEPVTTSVTETVHVSTD